MRCESVSICTFPTARSNARDMLTLDDLILDLNGAQIFSKLDLKAGYHQLELDEESRQIMTFSTHVGIRHYKRLFFGINCASEIFQNTISQVIDGIPGVKNIADDIIVCGTSTAEHDRRLDLLLCRLVEKGLTQTSVSSTRQVLNTRVTSLAGMAHRHRLLKLRLYAKLAHHPTQTRCVV